MPGNIREAPRPVNPQPAPGACWMVASGCRSCKAPSGWPGSRSQRWHQMAPQTVGRRASRSSAAAPPARAGFVPWFFHSEQLNARFLGRLISSGTVPREFTASARGHRCARANKILPERRAEEQRAQGRFGGCTRNQPRVSRGQI